MSTCERVSSAGTPVTNQSNCGVVGVRFGDSAGVEPDRLEHIGCLPGFHRTRGRLLARGRRVENDPGPFGLEGLGAEAHDRDENGDGGDEEVDRHHLPLLAAQVRGGGAEHEQRNADGGEADQRRREVE